jgi:xylulokinase
MINTANKPLLVIAHDVGTSGTKTILISISDKIEIVSSHLTEYGILYPEGIKNGAEQVANDWWQAICDGTKKVLESAEIAPESINVITFSTQSQCSLFVDDKGDPLDNPYIMIDGRAVKEFEAGMRDGLIKISGYNLFKTARYLRITGGAPGSAKDPLWKYAWFKNNRPEQFKKLYKMLDCKDYLIFKCTGKFYCTGDSASTVWLFDSRKGRMNWHQGLCKQAGVSIEHLPEIKLSSEIAGPLLPEAAREMGLIPGIPVNMGGIDATCLPVGSGAVELNDSHIYVGTSGWVVTIVDKRISNIQNYEGSIVSAMPGHYFFIGLEQTSGGCLAWAKDHLADLEIAEAERQGISPYTLLDEMASQSPPGANGLIFMPWMYGNRAPREDTRARGDFFNLSMNNGRRDMFRAILEGIAMHSRWIIEGFHKSRVPITEPIRFVGGGASSTLWCQIMADVLQKQIQPVRYAKDSGAIGAAIIAAVGLNSITFKEAKGLIPVLDVIQPRKELAPIYDKHYSVFRRYYDRNKDFYKQLND